MNIWFFSHYAGTPRQPHDTRDYYFALELVKAGINSTIIAAAFNHRTRRDEILAKRQCSRIEPFEGWRFIWIRTIPYFAGNDWRRAANMLSYFFSSLPLSLRMVGKNTVVIGVTPHPFCALAAWLVSRLKQARFILDVRDPWPDALISLGGFKADSAVVKMLRAVERFLYRSADKIITVMPNSIDYIKSYGIPADKIVYIPNGVSTELYLNSAAELPVEYEKEIAMLKSQNGFLVGYVGAFGGADAVHTIIDTCALLQQQGHTEIHFMLVGGGPDKNRLVEHAGELGLSNISFHSPVAKLYLPAFLSAMDALILTKARSNVFRFGVSFLKLFDYMMAARPIIWAVESVNNPVAESGCGVSITPEDAEAAAEAVLQIAGMTKQERHRMGVLGRDYVIKYHSSTVLAEKLLKTISELK
ncbi:MAG: glycosyltransferase family 4 protein [Dehalococcoidia bacterium]|nr:glycosyltransferase family 4 protein [Dehalococcoidia bacterium]